MTVIPNGVHREFHKSLMKRSLTYVQVSTSCSLVVNIAKWPIGYF